MTATEMRTELFAKMIPMLGDEIVMAKILAFVNSLAATKDNSDQRNALTREERKMQFLKLAGSWATDSEGEEYYQIMRNRNSGKSANREIISFD